ncbi:MAG: hypothetical protein ACKO7W_07685 [Elainella sp.]
MRNNNSFASPTVINPRISGATALYRSKPEVLDRADRSDVFALPIAPGRFRASATLTLTDIGAKERFNLKAELFFSSSELTQNAVVPVGRPTIVKSASRTIQLNFENPASTPSTLYIRFTSPMRNLRYQFSATAQLT